MAKNPLIAQRNVKLVKMFHELYNVKRKRIDDVLRELSEEHFFLKQDTIYSLIFYDAENREYYEALCDNKDAKVKN